MPILAVYDTQEEIPEAHAELFTERGGKWELTGVTGIKTVADTDRLQKSLAAERDEHKETKIKLAAFDSVDLEQIAADQATITELQAKVDAGAGEGFDEEKFNAAVDRLATARVKTELLPVQRELDKTTKENGELIEENAGFKTKETNRTITDSVRTAALESKVVPTALDDILMLAERMFEISEDGEVITRDGVGVTPGVRADVWFEENKEKRAHWWPLSNGGGSGGGDGGGGFENNPFAAGSWNLTGQGQLVKEDPTKADRWAKAAGTFVGGQRPVPPVAQK